MAKPEWGNKRSCPKCGTRFYDLGKEDPAVCIDCGHEWVPEPLLKSKQHLPNVPAKKPTPKPEVEEEDLLADDDLEVDEEVDDDDDDDVTVDVDDDDDVPDVVVVPKKVAD